jgi:fibronectin-binding autotransporter adhesin
MRRPFPPVKAALATVLIQLGLGVPAVRATAFAWSGGGSGTSARKGIVVFTANNTYTGITTVTAGTPELNNDGAANNGRIGASSPIDVARNTTFLFSGSGLMRDRVNNSGTLILGSGTTANTGGHLNTGGLSEGTARTGPGGADGVVGMSALTLRANATIDFSSANGGSELVFQTFNFIYGTVSNVIRWTGTAGADGSDRLLFAANPNLTANDPRFVQFTNDAGINFATGGMTIDSNGYYELAPAPEPGTWAAASMVLLAVGLSQRRRLGALLGRA